MNYDRNKEYYVNSTAKQRHNALDFLIATEGKQQARAMLANLARFYKDAEEPEFKSNFRKAKKDLAYVEFHKKLAEA